jgi:hypothetical protein
MEIKQEIVALMNDFFRKHGQNPTKLHLTLREENELILLPETDLIKGPRHTFKEGICGLKILWDSKEFKVD